MVLVKKNYKRYYAIKVKKLNLSQNATLSNQIKLVHNQYKWPQPF